VDPDPKKNPTTTGWVLTANRAKVMVAPVEDQTSGEAAWQQQQDKAKQALLDAAMSPQQKKAAAAAVAAANKKAAAPTQSPLRSAPGGSSTNSGNSTSGGGGGGATSGGATGDGCPCYFEASNRCTVRCDPSPDADALAELDKGRVVKAMARGSGPHKV